MSASTETPLHLSPSCRILTVSSSLERALSFVQQIRTLSGHAGDSDTINADALEDSITDTSSTFNEKYVPWTISNKYYTANVHFLARTVNGLAPYQLKSAPAVIFVWEKGEAYKHHVVRLAQDLEGTETDVSLAVRVPGKGVPDDGQEDEEEFEESGEIDEFLSSKGFEFVDSIQSISEDDDLSSGDIPSLPRVLDALSTIMWPSMQAAAARKPRVKSQPIETLDWARSSFDHNGSEFSINEDELVVPQNPAIGLAGQARIKKEMAELARWLEDDDYTVSKDDPWSHSSRQMMVSPTSEEEVKPDVDGFEDDFTVFVSAPPIEEPTRSVERLDSDSEGFPNFAKFGDSSFGVEEELSFDSLAPPDSHGGLTYHSLGSVSDLGDHDDEDGLPTKDEIRLSAARIFGPGPGKTRSDEGGASEGVDGNEDYDMAPFDLSNVISALQGMKEEISGMNDEGERRRAAATVALGLVYGLDRNDL